MQQKSQECTADATSGATARWVQGWHARATQLMGLLHQVADDFQALSASSGQDLATCRRRMWILMDACQQQLERMQQIHRQALVSGIKGSHLSPLAVQSLERHKRRFVPSMPALGERLAQLRGATAALAHDAAAARDELALASLAASANVRHLVCRLDRLLRLYARVALGRGL